MAANIDNYTGQTLSLKIKTTVDPLDVPLKTVKNSAVTTIDKDVKLTSNETVIRTGDPVPCKV